MKAMKDTVWDTSCLSLTTNANAIQKYTFDTSSIPSINRLDIDFCFSQRHCGKASCVEMFYLALAK